MLSLQERKAEEERPSGSLIANKSLEATGSQAHLLTNTLLGANDLKKSEEWSVDKNNCLEALLAIADTQPRRLTLIARHDDPEPLNSEAVAALGKATTSCVISLKLFRSFCHPEHHNTDQEYVDFLLGKNR